MATEKEKLEATTAQQLKDQEGIDSQRDELKEMQASIKRDREALSHERKVHSKEVEAFDISKQGVIPESGAGLVPTSETMTATQIELEAFMNEWVQVIVPKSGDKEENPVPVPSVNGVNQPIILGQVVQVRRKFIEVLAHSRIDQVLQKEENPLVRVEGLNVESNAALTHNFNTIGDTDKGNAWLTNLLAEPM